MPDNDAHLQSEGEEVKTSGEQTEQTNDEGSEKMIPKSRLDSVISQRDEYKTKFEETDEKLSELQSTIKELQDSVKEKQTQSDGETFTSDEEMALDRISKGLKNKQFITKEDLEEIRKIDHRNNELNRLSSKYKKGSGYPEFRSDEVMVYAQKRGFGDNLEAAYKDMNWDAFLQAEAKKMSGGPEPPDSEKPTGGERDTQTQVTRNAISNMSTTEYEQNRDTILDKFRKSVLGK